MLALRGKRAIATAADRAGRGKPFGHERDIATHRWRHRLASVTLADMINNDVLRSIRYMLDLSDARVVEIARLADAGFELDKAEVQAFLKKDDDEGYVECSDRVLAHFLDGLVIDRRGRNDGVPARAVEKRITNNLVLKKLRVAFELKDVDMHQSFADAGFPVSKPELSALFRVPGHSNFRRCGDQLLRNFLKGLTQRLRPA